MKITPDRRLYTKAWLTLATITVFVALLGGLAQLLVLLLAEPADEGTATVIIWSIAGGLVLLLWLFAVPITALWIRNLEYQALEDKVVIHKGIIDKVDQSIPLRMVTDFRLHRSLYDRWLGIGSIEIQTAGQSNTATGYEGRLSGLAEWEQLHEDLRERIRRTEPGGVTRRSGTEVDDLHALLDEVREIRRLLEATR